MIEKSSDSGAVEKGKIALVATRLTMTQSTLSGHCERFEQSRRNLKTLLGDFFNSPAATY